MPLQLELLVNNDPRVLPAVRVFAHEALRQFPMDASGVELLVELVARSAQSAIDRAFPHGMDGSVKIGVHESAGKLMGTVRDDGMPQDVQTMERQLHESDLSQTRLFGIPCADIADEVHWVAFGPEGKELQVVRWLHDTHITAQLPPESLTVFQDSVPLAPVQSYAIRRMSPDEAVQISQLVYRAYGGTYFNRDVYYPERVAAQNERGVVLSFVAQGQDARLVGHYALELNQEGPVGEGGQAVVDPAHRGRGLLLQMKDAAMQAARQLDLIGLYADAVTVHTMTQKSNVDHAAHLCCVDLGIAPRDEQFRGIAEQQPQRVTCLLYFHWLQPPQPRTVHVPSRHSDIVQRIYDNLQCPVTLATGAAPTGHGTLSVEISAGARRASVRAEQLGKDSVASIRHTHRELIEHDHAEAVFVELPLQDPATPQVSQALEEHGFAFAGVAPHFSPRGDLLRLVYLTEPLARAPILTYEDFAASLVDYVLAEQTRVRTLLD
jgi:hypothetical protein